MLLPGGRSFELLAANSLKPDRSLSSYRVIQANDSPSEGSSHLYQISKFDAVCGDEGTRLGHLNGSDLLCVTLPNISSTVPSPRHAAQLRIISFTILLLLPLLLFGVVPNFIPRVVTILATAASAAALLFSNSSAPVLGELGLIRLCLMSVVRYSNHALRSLKLTPEDTWAS